MDGSGCRVPRWTAPPGGAKTFLFQLVRIPRVIGNTLHDALAVMADAGLVTITRPRTPPAQGCNPGTAGTVIATEPAGGIFAPAPVTLTVCSIPS
jgi:hypothetical protein